jgi:hypothetical protein
MSSKKALAIAFALVLTFTIAACGTSKKTDNVSAADSSKGEKQSDGLVATSTTVRSYSSDTSGPSDTTYANSSASVLGSSSDCLAASVAYASLFVEASGFAGGADQSQVDDFESKTRDLKAKIPEAERSDFQTVATAYQKYAEAVKGIDYTDLLNPTTQDKIKQAADGLDDPAVKDAQTRIDAYFAATCNN